MSGGANKKFIKDPVNVLRKYPIIPYSLESKVLPSDDGVVQVNIEQRQKVYLVKPIPSNPSEKSHNFPAYYLRYIDEGKTVANLGDEADYFFTDPLSGCTVSCGRGAAPLIIHYNWKKEGTIDQDRIDSDVAGKYLVTPGIVRKDDYQERTDTSATVVGVRNKKTGIWTFYYQVYDSKDKVLRVRTM